MNEFWQTCISRLEQELPPQQISAWIRPLVPLAFDEAQGLLRVTAPNRFKLDWVRKNFSHQIEVLASEWYARPVQVSFELPSSGASQRGGPSGATAPMPATGNGVAALRSQPAQAAAPAVVASHSPSPGSDAAGLVYERSRLNTDLTFENFVTGKANQLARAAALQVAENPGTSYNPLFFYGGVGLGKTHLIHAIGNAMVAAGTGTHVRYVHADQYVADVVKAYQRKTFDDFKRYYHSLDLLLIDDIQFFAGKNRTQEEFFYAFNALIEGGKRVIMTCDSYPKQIEGMEERLISRFSWGLTVEIQPPELEMRVAILMKKAEADSIKLDHNVAFFIAQNVRSNVRELEGALKRVVAYARFTNQNISLELVKEALKDILAAGNRQVTVDAIQKTVAEYYKIKLSDMHSKKRSRDIARPRQVAMALAKELTQLSLPNIGDAFGGRDHTTVLHACKTIAEMRGNDTDIAHDYDTLLAMLRN